MDRLDGTRHGNCPNVPDHFAALGFRLNLESFVKDKPMTSKKSPMKYARLSYTELESEIERLKALVTKLTDALDRSAPVLMGIEEFADLIDKAREAVK